MYPNVPCWPTIGITTNVLLVGGDEDQLFCGLLPPCDSPIATFALEPTFYPKAASFNDALIPNAGHDLNLEKNA